MNDFTKGNARVVDDGLYTVCIGTLKVCHFTPFDLSGMCKTDEENAKLTAVAFTTATKLAEAGYDAVKVLELLPKIMHSLEQSCEFRYHAGMEIEEIQCTTGQTTKHKAP